MFRMEPAPLVGEARNVINGYHRRFSRGPTNMWISDPTTGMPQELIICWSSSQSFSVVEVTFDNLTAFRHDTPWESGKRVVPHMVKAYELAYRTEGTWHDAVAESCNYHRFRRHQIGTVTADAVRLRILETHGEGESARVYQVRILP